MFEHAAKLNWEGIISKRADAAYRSERTEAWLKIKTVQREKFPVIGFVKDPTGVAALYLGKREGKELVYTGGKDVFVHISAVERAGLSSLNEGAKLSYEVVANRGKESAENLRVG